MGNWYQNLILLYDTLHNCRDYAPDDTVKLCPIYYSRVETNLTITLNLINNSIDVEKSDKLFSIYIPSTLEAQTRTSQKTIFYPIVDNINRMFPGIFTNKEPYLSDMFFRKLKKLENKIKNDDLTLFCKLLDENPNNDLFYELVDMLKQNCDMDKDMKLIPNVIIYRIVNGEGKKINLFNSLEDDWIRYCSTEKSDLELCLDNNEIAKFSNKFPYVFGNRKLISANKEDFTFLGRFSYSDELSKMSEEGLYKAHYALQFLNLNRINSIPFYENNMVLFIFTLGCNPYNLLDFNINNNTSELLTNRDKYKNILDETGNDYTKKIKDALKLYNLDYKNHNSRVCIIGFNNISKGRSGISFYKEFEENEYYEKIEKWHEDCKWYYIKPNKEYIIETPKLNDIIDCVTNESDKSSIKNSIKYTLLYCIFNNSLISRHIVDKLYNKAINPAAIMRKGQSWNKVLSVTCGILRKYYIDYKKETFDPMELDKTIKDRSYLYGRLLAIADFVERKVLRLDGKDRPTNALNYMQTFSSAPARTWKTIYNNIVPYLKRDNYLRLLSEKQIIEIMSIMKQDELENTVTEKPLTSKFLFGFFLQKKELYNKKEEKEIDNNE